MSAGAGSPPSGPALAFAGIFAVTFCGLLAVGAVLPVLPRYVHGPLDGGNIAVGVVVGSYAVTGLLLRPVAGRFADRRGRKPTVLVGSLLVAVAGFLYLLPLGVAGLIAARLVLGAGEGTVFTAGSAWIVDLAPPERRGRVIGLYGLAVWGGLSVGPLIGELLLHASGYTLVWLFAGGDAAGRRARSPPASPTPTARRLARARAPAADRPRGGAARLGAGAGLDRLRDASPPSSSSTSTPAASATGRPPSAPSRRWSSSPGSSPATCPTGSARRGWRSARRWSRRSAWRRSASPRACRSRSPARWRWARPSRCSTPRSR